ncbi:Transmembrane protein 170A [Pteropus alecto]|uniref:Transmembrane protein 170A n=1 Tax=Pteropus alecto TaxID=9402 RepID=L5KVH8_PTEAL|nr:Transmembrane protein 170A [Pteropus alecto]
MGPETCKGRRIGLLTAVINKGPVIFFIHWAATARRHSMDTWDLCTTYLVFYRTEMWYGVFLWALVSSLFFHVPAGLLALFTLRHHKYGRFMSVSILLMGIVGPITAGILTSAAIAGVYRAAGKEMIPFEALTLGTGQTFCVVVVSFLRVLATL